MRFGCHVPAKDTFLLGAFTSFILLLPGIFYLSAYLNSDHKRQSYASMKVKLQGACLSTLLFLLSLPLTNVYATTTTTLTTATTTLTQPLSNLLLHPKPLLLQLLLHSY